MSQPPWDYPQPEFVQPHVQQHNSQPSFAPRNQQQWKPPEVGRWTYPGTPQPQPKPGRRRVPYPSHLVRFPSELVGFGGKRRGRGPSIWRMVYLGTHPVALLMTAFLFMIMAEFVAGWFLLVFSCWLLWVLAVTTGWACHAAAVAIAGGRRGRLRPLAP